MDSPTLVAYSPRVVQGLIAAAGDVGCYTLTNNLFGKQVARYGLFLQLVSYFTFYSSVRTFSNSVEAVLCTWALASWPWDGLHDSSTPSMSSNRSLVRSLSLAALSIVIRPTACIMWMIMGVYLLCQKKEASNLTIILTQIIPIAITALSASLLIDRICYGSWVFVLWNFVKFNVIEGLSVLYGEHPWYWYFTNALPSVAGPSFLAIITGVYLSYRSKPFPLILVFFNIVVYSTMSHKELRFLQPLLPILHVYGGVALFNMKLKTSKTFYNTVITLLIISNAFPAFYLSRYHQVLEVIDDIHLITPICFIM